MIYEVWKQWHECRSLLIKELGICITHNEDDILIGLANGQLRLWSGKKSAIVTRIKTEPRLKIVECILVSGDLEEIRAMGLKIEKWAVEQGCSLALHIGRNGWAKVMDDYDNMGVCIAKEL